VDAGIKFGKGDMELGDAALKMGEGIGFAAGVGGTSQAVAMAKYLRRYNDGEEDDSVPMAAVHFLQGKKENR
jgi:hypothetical protein